MDKKFDLNKWFAGITEKFIFERPIGKMMNTKFKTKVIQLSGIEIVLFEDGTYNLSDTTG